MPRILFLTIKYPSNTAISIRVRYFKEALINSGYDVIVHELKLGSKATNLLKYLMPSIDKELRASASQVDLIYTTTPPPILPILAHKLYKELGIKYIVDIRDAWEEYAKETYPTFIVKLIERKYLKALRQALSIIVVTEYLANLYKRKLGVDPVVIPNGTDTSIIKCRDEDHEGNTIAVLADFNNPYQELSPLLKALTMLPQLHLIVIGSGKYLKKYMEEAIKLGINDRISWVGHVDYNKLSKFLCRASIGVVCRPAIESPAYQSAIPSKTYDYLAAGLPVLGYGPRNAQLDKFLTEHEVGLYIEGNDPNKIAKGIVKLLKDANNLRKKAREIANRYSRPKLAKTLITIIRRLC